MVALRPPRPGQPPRRGRSGAPGRAGRRLLAACAAGAVLGPLALVAALPPGPARAQEGDGYGSDAPREDAPREDAPREVADTGYGPLDPADRALLVRLQHEGLWQIPAGELAAERAAADPVREIGTRTVQDYSGLAEQIEAAATELQVDLPTEPRPAHQARLERLDARSGEEFDAEFVQVLREAHGATYPDVAYARAGTQNPLVRDVAKAAEEMLGEHMELLEGSGLVDWGQIPPPPGPAGSPSRFLAAEPAGVNPLLVWLLLGAAAVGAVVTAVRTARPR